MNSKHLDKLETQAFRAEEKARLIRLKIRKRDNALAAALGSIALSRLNHPLIRQMVVELLPHLRDDQKDLVKRQLEKITLPPAS